MKLSRNVEHALALLPPLVGATTPESLGRLAAVHGVPYREAIPVFRALRDAGLVTCRAGRGGGVLLNRNPDLITLRDIIEAVDGSFFPENAMTTGTIQRITEDLRTRIGNWLGQMNLAQL